MKTYLFLLLFMPFLVLAQKKVDAALSKKIQEFDSYVTQAQKDWEVPGLAIAVVKNGEVIFKKGYGVRELGKPEPVDTQTLFACASTTKAMTVACMGMLVDEGKINWNDEVIKYIPEFQLFDPYMTREIKIRDLFIHDTGLGNADFLWGYMNISSEEVLGKMRWVEPSYSLRSSFIYQNIFYLAAGKVIEKVSGKPWHQFMAEKIFKPLAMTRTVPLIKEAVDKNKTMPHDKIEGKMTVIEHTSADQIGPAGSVWSCADDMGKWMQCMIDSSKYNGGRLLSAKTWTEMFKPQVLVPPSQFYPTMQLTKPNWTTYGLGWFQHDYKGRKVNFHTGSLAGAVAIHAQLPDEKLGIYVFGNSDHAEIRHALVYKTFDHFALGGTRDWSSEFLKLYNNLKVIGESQIKNFEAKRTLNTSPSLPIETYAGKYSDPLYGEVEVTAKGNQLIFNVNNFVKTSFEHWHYDTFYGWYDKKWYGKGFATFSIDAEGKISKLNFEGIEFKRSAKQ
jgi:CubicO group peptidase (beta-lactamase class C family)